MTSFDDLELNPSGPGLYRPGRSNRARWAIGIIALVAIAAAVGYLVTRGTRPQESPTPAAVQQPVAQKPEGTALVGDNIVLPPLPETDSLVRELVGRLSTHPAVMAWLATKGLISNFTVVTHNISEGRSPTTHLKALAPKAPFRTKGSGSALSVDARSYERYNVYGDAVAALDATGTARLYLTLKPRILDAYGELGYPAGDFDRVLERAIGALLQVPVVEGDIALRPKIISYAYADPKLESLSAAQKQFLRMGPRNVQVVQAKLREIATLLNLHPDRPAR